MQREIKFRVWCPDATMIEWDEFAYDFTILPGKDHFHFADFFTSFIDQGARFLQYTGLKDKHGTEIYEGDILKLYVGGRRVRAEVFWDADLEPDSYMDFGWKARAYALDDVPARWTLDGLGTYSDEVLPGFWHHFEIVGNIYQNPDMLSSSTKG